MKQSSQSLPARWSKEQLRQDSRRTVAEHDNERSRYHRDWKQRQLFRQTDERVGSNELRFEIRQRTDAVILSFIAATA